MKKILILLLLVVFTNSQAQYSTYYNVNSNQNVNVNSNINKTVSVSGSVYENKTIRTIDYGALQLANAQKEKNRLENIKYADEQQGRISIEIATDPVKAYDYGFQKNYNNKGKSALKYGFKQFALSFIVPHNSVFVEAGAGRFENVSLDGITTEIIFRAPLYNKEKKEIDVEKIAKLDSVKVETLNEKMGPDGQAIFVHKKDIHRATIFGIKGYKGTLIWEDDYQYTIADSYSSFNKNEGDGILFRVEVNYYGDKDKVTFEQLEGRRYYLQRLIEKVISTAVVGELKY